MTNTTNDIELRPLSHVELIAHLTKRCESLTAERDTLKALCVEYQSALEKIAAYNDEASWAEQRAHNSYSSFDEPQSVEIAHTVLTRARSILK